MDRRRFLFGRYGAEADPRTPPWAVAYARFVELCGRCGECLRACPTGILAPGDDGFPSVDFKRGSCTFCRECVHACRSGALSAADADGNPLAPWSRVAAIDRGCLALRGVVCRICTEHCDAGAVRVRLAVSGAAAPEIAPVLCNGCGTCVAPCPAHAISVRPAGAWNQGH